jgi:Astacin (Peptidase family M12A)/Polyglycine hydrolase-like, structural repeat
MGKDEIVVNNEAVGSRETRTGYLSGPGFVDAAVRYSVVNGIAIFDGCIDMGPVEEVEARAAEVRTARAGGAGQADEGINFEQMGVGLPPDSSFLWTNGIVPFVVDGGLINPTRVTQAIAHLQENSPIRFVPRTNQANYVGFVRNPNENWSSSAIGMRGGEQLIRLSDGATMGTVAHECCHAFGVLHEQSRCDRDKFVQINYQNIQDGFESNFDKFCVGYQDYFDYDFGSIMHYPGTAFSKNNQPTIVPLKPGVTLGQRNGLSIGDRLTIAHMYARFFGSGHTGVWRTGTGKYGLWVNATWDSFSAKWAEWAAQGLRLVDIHVRRVGNENRYSGVWLAGTGGYGLWANATWDSFKTKWQEWSGQGLRLVDLHVLRVGNEDRYSGAFLPGTGGHALWVNASWDSFKAKWAEWAEQGLRLVDLNVSHVGNQDRYSGVWLPGTGGYGLWANASWESFVDKWKTWAGQGLRLVDIAVHQAAGGNRYSGAFLPGTDAYYLWANVPWESFRARWQQLSDQGMRLVDYEFTEPAQADVAQLDIAGTPMPATAETLPAGVGGIGDDSGVLKFESVEIEADVTMAGGDGYGGYQPGDVAAAPAAGVDGLGGALTGRAGTPAAGSEADGQGGAVVEPTGTPSRSATPPTDKVKVEDGVGDYAMSH